jgi:hypothetical protein
MRAVITFKCPYDFVIAVERSSQTVTGWCRLHSQISCNNQQCRHCTTSSPMDTRVKHNSADMPSGCMS